MKELTNSEFIGLIKSTSSKTIKLKFSSSVKMSKKNNPLLEDNKTVVKNITGEFEIGGTYESRVNENANTDIIDSSTFKSGKLRWGRWFDDDSVGKIILHEKDDGEGKLVPHYYLRYYNAKDTVSTEYLVDGKPATEKEISTIKEFSPKKKSTPKTQESVGLTEQNKVYAQCVDFDNIISFSLSDGTEYKLMK
jgi:hypothetical protein